MNLSGSFIFVSILTMTLSGLCLNAIGEELAKTKKAKLQPLPMDLIELLNFLPACPDKWVMKRSQARRIYRDNLEAYAVREYEKPVESQVKGTENAAKPETVLIVIRDTCGLGPHIKPFREETAPAQGGDYKLGNWDGYPGMLVRLGNNRKALRVLVADRFVVELVFSGDNPKSLNLWMERCKLKALARAKKEALITIRKNVALKFLDELHPERTRRYSLPVEPGKPDVPAVMSQP